MKKLKNIDINLSLKGAYVLNEESSAMISLIASGSELELIIDASEELYNEGITTRIISVPCLDRFYIQDKKYKDEVIGNLPKVIVEAGVRQSWDHLMSSEDVFIGMSSFGSSAPAKDLYKKFKITKEEIIKSVKIILDK